MIAPEGICRNCYWTWKASRPRAPGVYCWHAELVARPTPDGWQVEQAKSKAALERLRQEGIR